MNPDSRLHLLVNFTASRQNSAAHVQHLDFNVDVNRQYNSMNSDWVIDNCQ